MNTKKIDLQKDSPSSMFSSFRRWGRTAVLALGLNAAATGAATVATETASQLAHVSVAHAQDTAPSLTAAQRTELFRLFRAGNTAFHANEYTEALDLFRQAEAINTIGGASIDADLASILSWNICQIYTFQSGFRLFTSDASERPSAATSRRREINEGNSRRLEEVLGFSTLAQLQPVRESLLEAQRRLREIQQAYEQQLLELGEGHASRRADLERGLDDTRRAVVFIDTTLQRIQVRYAELEAASVSRDDGHDRDDTTDDHVVVVGGEEFVEHREDVWFTTPRAVTLATGVAGLAAGAVGLTGYFLNLSDGNAILSQCRELQTSGMPCPESLERSFHGASDRAEAFGVTAWIGAGVGVASTILFLVLPSETRVTREPRITVTPTVSDTTSGLTVSGTF